MDHVDFWFDPLCPYSWITSRWMVEVQRQEPVTVRWRPLSLGLLHTAPGAGPDELQELARGPVRVLAAAAAAHGTPILGRLYTTLGQRLHDDGGALADIRVGFRDGRSQWLERLGSLGPVRTAALTDAGLETGLAGAATDTRWDDALRAELTRVPTGDRPGAPIGVPTVSVNGAPGQFGPVLSEILAGERALRLWAAFRAIAEEDAFFELKKVTDRALPNTSAPVPASRPGRG